MRPIRFGIIGEYQSGKSLLINCLLRRPIATVGVGMATTHTVVNYLYAAKEYVAYVTKEGTRKVISIDKLRNLDTETDVSEINVYLSNAFLKDYILTDMPGFGANEEDDVVARKVLRQIDFAILIAWNEKVMGANSESFIEIKELKTFNVPYYFYVNCTNSDRWGCDEIENVKIASEDLSLLNFYKPSSFPLGEKSVNIVNLMWYWFSICKDSDELIKRKKNKTAFNEYGINLSVKEKVGEASNFNLISKLFGMDNKIYLELKREIKDEIKRLKDEVCPIGSIQAFGYNSIPDGWLLCDGHSVLITEYQELYETIGITFGGDGKKYFNVPDLRGRFIRGCDNSGEVDPDRIFGSFQDDSIQSHLHSLNAEQIKISKEGRHNHPLWCEEMDSVYDVSGFVSSSKTKRMCYPSYKKGVGKTDLGESYAGAHAHKITLLGTPIGTPIQDGNDAIRISEETRPKNVALLYCIKCK